MGTLTRNTLKTSIVSKFGKYNRQWLIFLSGINMYAMLTGFLPYMMEPFNVMEMYEKMMQRKMTPIPHFLSRGKCGSFNMGPLINISNF